MSPLAFFVQVCALLLATTFNSIGVPISVFAAQHFPSPDGRFVAHIISKDDGWCYLSIKDTKNGTVDESQKVELTPVFAISWTGDSKTIVSVGHIAHGSIATIFHRTNACWDSNIINPPDDPVGDRVTEDVVGLTTKKKNVLLSYKMYVENRLEDGTITSETYYTIFEINPETQHFDKIEKRPYNVGLPGAEDWNGNIPKVSQ